VDAGVHGGLTYRITGGRPVAGEIRCLGAKNFATKAMVAALLGSTPTTLGNVPEIGDVDITLDLLRSIDVSVERRGTTLVLDPAALRGRSQHAVPTPHSGLNRIPILLLGVLLHHGSSVHVPLLGGCSIGARRVDYHLEALRAFGAVVHETPTGFEARAPARLRGAAIALPYPSVGATETCLYASVLAQGRTLIRNAAIEPEILELIRMLRGMGAMVFRAGREIRVEGVRELRGTRCEILGDRVEAASWASLACASDGNILVRGIRRETLASFLPRFAQVGGGVSFEDHESIRFYRKAPLRVAAIETDVWPGFSTDWQQPFAVLLCRADGISVIHETVYEDRFGYLRALRQLGASAQLTEDCLSENDCRYRRSGHAHSAIIRGPAKLVAVPELAIPDLRAGLAYLIAAAIAEGTTTLTGIEYLERGYGNIVPRLRRMNLEIERAEEPTGVVSWPRQLE
jgi:UDP-N-acetylglucosamine 1-carboxyvinyltransferase